MAPVLAWYTLASVFSFSMVQAEVQEFGIGFDFTPAYGTSAVSYANGSNLPLARVEGGDAWKQLMLDLHLRKNRWTEFPSATLPLFTRMLRSLRTESEAIIGTKIQNATVAWASSHNTDGQYWHKGLLDWVKEAFAAAGLNFIQISSNNYAGDPILYPENSIQAGHGFGLCYPYTTSVEDCARDNYSTLPNETYFFVGYYANELEVTGMLKSRLAYSVWNYPYVSFDLGADARKRGSPDAYWEQVRQLLSMPFVDSRSDWPTKVIFYGDESGDEHLRRVTKDVLTTFMDNRELPEGVEDGVDATFAGALGAAEFAKRWPYWNHGRPWLVPGLTVQTS